MLALPFNTYIYKMIVYKCSVIRILVSLSSFENVYWLWIWIFSFRVIGRVRIIHCLPLKLLLYGEVISDWLLIYKYTKVWTKMGISKGIMGIIKKPQNFNYKQNFIIGTYFLSRDVKKHKKDKIVTLFVKQKITLP